MGIDGGRLCWQRREGGRASFPLERLRLRGRHQQCNLAVAAQGAADFGVGEAVIREGLSSFRGLPHRLQWIGRRRGRDWYDDSKATNPAAAAAALRALGRAVWICGGVTKGCDLKPLLPAVRDGVERMVVIGRDPEPFVALARAAAVAWEVADGMEDAVARAAAVQPPLPVVLAPAAASFDLYADYAARGEAFVRAVEQLG
ncbi:MAG: hypothetical protein D6682_05040 [Zetaproteobacteria bacterium]|nr:MAG: hypothetical protein D6682_05040 [Zetaproteobacteria bacterium]